MHMPSFFSTLVILYRGVDECGRTGVNDSECTVPWRVHLAYEVVVFVVAVPSRAVAFICAHSQYSHMLITIHQLRPPAQSSNPPLHVRYRTARNRDEMKHMCEED
jgi:hypothetical protein